MEGFAPRARGRLLLFTSCLEEVFPEKLSRTLEIEEQVSQLWDVAARPSICFKQPSATLWNKFVGLSECRTSHNHKHNRQHCSHRQQQNDALQCATSLAIGRDSSAPSP